MHCAACGTEIPLASGERVGFRDECPRCGADLHACRQCAHYDPGAYNACREPQAERVSDRERANRCDWFAPSSPPNAGAPNGASGRLDPAAEARQKLDALFRKR